MSLVGRLTAWLAAPFHPPAQPDPRRLEQQQRESAVLLRQLRAELRLMRLWRSQREPERPGAPW